LVIQIYSGWGIVYGTRTFIYDGVHGFGWLGVFST